MVLRGGGNPRRIARIKRTIRSGKRYKTPGAAESPDQGVKKCPGAALVLALRRFWGLASRSAALLSENWTAPSWMRPMTPSHSRRLIHTFCQGCTKAVLPQPARCLSSTALTARS